MADADMESLQEELKAFREEKEKIRGIVGQIGGKQATKRNKLMNILFILLLASLLFVDFSRHIWKVQVTWLPPLFSLELGLLLVSIKIIWMIHQQQKVELFQFWILNSIEFRLNDISKRVGGMEDHLKQAEPQSQGASSPR